MRTVRTKVYQFNELSNEAKETAINHYRNNSVDTSFIYDDAQKTVEAFHEVFNTKEGRNSWLDVNTNSIDDDILNLKGLRLRKYLINNFYSSLYKRKYLGCIGDNKVIKHRMSKTHYYDMAKGARVNSSNFIYSNINFTNSCVLTGVCYDDSLLQPIYEFLESGHKKDSFNYLTFEMLINDCFDELKKDIENEENSMYKDEQIIEAIEANEYEFTIDGNIF